MFMSRRNFSIAAGMAAAVALTAGALIASTVQTSSATEPGELAPDFTGVTATGETVSLADFAGKTVILEWTNDGCPFVQKHYAVPPASMQGLQTDAAESDVVWLSVISSAPGKQGHRTGAEVLDMNTARGATPAHVILDASGEIGRAYGAKTTPHMFLITPEGAIAYQGAIDDKPSARVADLETATNYVRAAMDSLAAGEPVETANTQPYGCSIKY
ncbi:MAG: thioredoxin family protein [Alphaproteobacteria bacterium]|nr:thioredoxin family protein [Hyphomonas sp.]MBR9806331.1 thioredoxin family protein [Alphaproteobacteria bacterium]|tara:strand:+ start:169 stop:816 length:648 start_codon:yes stop_codon:yes gene_type:complete